MEYVFEPTIDASLNGGVARNYKRPHQETPNREYIYIYIWPRLFSRRVHEAQKASKPQQHGKNPALGPHKLDIPRSLWRRGQLILAFAFNDVVRLRFQTLVVEGGRSSA